MRCCRAAADYRFPTRGIKQRAGFSGPGWTKHVPGGVWETRRTLRKLRNVREK